MYVNNVIVVIVDYVVVFLNPMQRTRTKTKKARTINQSIANEHGVVCIAVVGGRMSAYVVGFGPLPPLALLHTLSS